MLLACFTGWLISQEVAQFAVNAYRGVTTNYAVTGAQLTWKACAIMSDQAARTSDISAINKTWSTKRNKGKAVSALSSIKNRGSIANCAVGGWIGAHCALRSTGFAFLVSQIISILANLTRSTLNTIITMWRAGNTKCWLNKNKTFNAKFAGFITYTYLTKTYIAHLTLIIRVQVVGLDTMQTLSSVCADLTQSGTLFAFVSLRVQKIAIKTWWTGAPLALEAASLRTRVNELAQPSTIVQEIAGLTVRACSLVVAGGALLLAAVESLRTIITSVLSRTG